MKNALTSLIFCALASVALCQELNCSVQVNSSQIEGSEKTTFNAMQQSVSEFVNNRRWTNDKFEPHERIECSMLITVDKRLSTDQFEVTFQVTSNRPVYGSTYNSTMFKHQDKSINIRYLQFDVLDFSENTTLSNLTSVIAYYVYVILAMDYDSYAPNGGEEYWQMAQRIVANAQSTGESGWLAFSSRTNRYWIVENMLDARFKPMRKAIYDYHRKGFDQMAENVALGRGAVLEALTLLKPVRAAEPNSIMMRIFFNSKGDEIVKLFRDAEPTEKSRVINILSELDPANSSKYQAISSSAN